MATLPSDDLAAVQRWKREALRKHAVSSQLANRMFSNTLRKVSTMKKQAAPFQQFNAFGKGSAVNVISDADAARANQTPAQAARQGKLPRNSNAPMSDEDWAELMPYTPGAAMAMSDQDIDAVLQHGPTIQYSNPPKMIEHDRTNQHQEAWDEKNRRQAAGLGRLKGPDVSAFSDPARRQVQVQANPKSPETLRPKTSNNATMSPMTALDDAQLQAILDQARVQRASADVLAEPLSITPEKEASHELVRRAISPTLGKRVQPFDWK